MIYTLFTILLLEGFITISVEILTIRQLLPFFGGSVVITSIIISIFLLFLALGYWRGGNFQEKFFQQLTRNFTLSLIWIGVGLNYAFIGLFYYLTVIKIALPQLFSLFLFLILILAPIVYWLGQTVPLTTNLFNQQQRVSHISGRALFLSTIGSFLGALLTSLVIFQYLGVAWAVVINCILLFVLVLYISPKNQFSWLKILGLSTSVVFILLLNINTERDQFMVTNNYANYRVVESHDFSKMLQINNSSSSLITSDKKSFPYIQLIRQIIFDELKLAHKTILVVGAGGFTLTAAGAHENDVTYVDIDPQIKEIAESYFLNDKIQGKFVGEDARSFLQNTFNTYDVILSDSYSHQNTIPQALLTAEYFQALSRHLKPEGFAIINIIGAPFFGNDYTRIVHNTIHSVFPYCAVIPMGYQHTANMIYICPKTQLTASIYRDDLNTSTLDHFKAMS